MGRVFHDQHAQLQGRALQNELGIIVFRKVGAGAARPDDQAPFLQLVFDGLEQAARFVIVREQHIQIVPVRLAPDRAPFEKPT